MSLVFYNRRYNCGVCFSKYTPELLQSHPDTLFVFGDNLERKGTGGQAIIRNEPNAFGFVTKRYPSMGQDAYMTGIDEDYRAVYADFERLKEHLLQNRVILFPSGGLGTGLARLDIHAPELLNLIDIKVSRLIGADYATIRTNLR